MASWRRDNGYPNNTEQLLTKLARSDISCSDRNKQSSTTSHMQKLFSPHVISTEGRTEQNLIHWSVLCFGFVAEKHQI
ncbi:hypothetical protein MUK42_25685 [Musa troglodytarum]|uniref:Uncharacterized protein n=1 Tax=Musa troglodytarum TaxID=320322 RepID=A0A9E7L2U8_9LILI|nr:hypothetical protein MUK42_25685 [Musa troglodytarum]